MKKIRQHFTVLIVLCLVLLTACSNKTASSDNISEPTILIQTPEPTEKAKGNYQVDTTENPESVVTIQPTKDILVQETKGPMVQPTKMPEATKEPKDVKEETKEPERLEKQVTLTIAGVDDQSIILEETKVELKEGDTVFSVLLCETKNRKIQMEFSGGKKAAYIQGIDNLYEFDHGEMSGWMYSVNGEFPSVSCSDYKLEEGDKVEWLYTKDLGEDIGAKEF